MPRKKKEPIEGFNLFECRLCVDRPLHNISSRSIRKSQERSTQSNWDCILMRPIGTSQDIHGSMAKT